MVTNHPGDGGVFQDAGGMLGAKTKKVLGQPGWLVSLLLGLPFLYGREFLSILLLLHL